MSDETVNKLIDLENQILSLRSQNRYEIDKDNYINNQKIISEDTLNILIV